MLLKTNNPTPNFVSRILDTTNGIVYELMPKGNVYVCGVNHPQSQDSNYIEYTDESAKLLWDYLSNQAILIGKDLQ